jgi:hypothetical protein
MEKAKAVKQVYYSNKQTYTKSEVLGILNTTVFTPQTVKQVDDSPFISLYDYLGYAAGAQLGKQVAQAAVRSKEKIEKKNVQTRTYSGEILMYRKEFLREFFNNRKEPIEVEISLGDIQVYQL